MWEGSKFVSENKSIWPKKSHLISRSCNKQIANFSSEVFNSRLLFTIHLPLPPLLPSDHFEYLFTTNAVKDILDEMYWKM